MSFYVIVSYGYLLMLLIVATTGIACYKKLGISFKILTIATIISMITALLAIVSVKVIKTNAPVLHVEALSEYIFYSLIYYHLFNGRGVKNGIILSIIIVSVLSVINALIWQPFTSEFPTYMNLVTLASLAVFSLLLFRQMLLCPSKTPILKQGVFWYNTAIIFYSTTLFLQIGLSNVFKKNAGVDALVFYLWFVILYIFTILTGIAIVADSKENRKVHAI